MNSHWWKKGADEDFHARNKPMIMDVFDGLRDFNELSKLLVRPEWLDLTNEQPTKSMELVRTIKDEYIREVPKLLKGAGWLNRLAVHKIANFVYVLHKSDDMYYERFGWLINLVIQVAPEWQSATFDERIDILHRCRLEYFKVEHREDRIHHVTMAWDWIERKYATDVGIQRSVDFVVDRLYVHRDMFDYNEISRLQMMQFHPDNWYPVGRGQMWDCVHGGKG